MFKVLDLFSSIGGFGLWDGRFLWDRWTVPVWIEWTESKD